MAKIYKSFLFDGKKSEDFDVYITGSAVYDAPDRDVELVNIPGRNGALVIDRNRFNNITVTYPAGTYAKDQADFALKMEALRNFLASRKGYKRLEDEYNLDEFRLGIYKDGLQVDPVLHGKAGQFSLVFDCKPQRYLKSGEAPTEFTADGTIYNPTFFDASPLLEVEGRGEVVLNGFPIEINVDPLGEVPLFIPDTNSTKAVAPFYNPMPPYTAGDTIKAQAYYTFVIYPNSGRITSVTYIGATSDIVGVVASIRSDGKAVVHISTAGTFTEGTADVISGHVSLLVSGKTGSNQDFTDDLIYVGVKMEYDDTPTDEAPNGSMSAYYTWTDGTYAWPAERSVQIADGYIISTKTSLGESLFIDCEIGEVYSESGQSYNFAVSLGSRLPKLSPGENALTLANTIDKLKIIPRWWRI